MGWLGGVMIAAGYTLVSTQRLTSESRLFQGMNTLGGLMLGIACWHQGSLAPACLNAVWTYVGIRSLVKASGSRRPRPPAASVTSGPEFGAGSHAKWLGVREG